MFKQNRFNYVVLSLTMLTLLVISMSFLYSRDPAKKILHLSKADDHEKLLSELESRLVDRIDKHDSVKENLVKIEQQERVKDQESITQLFQKEFNRLETERMKLEEQKEAENKKQEEARVAEAFQKGKQDTVDAKRKQVHLNLMRQYREMEKKDDERLLRKIQLPKNDQGPSKIVIISAADKNGIEKNKTAFNMIQNNRKEYAKYHGYKYVFVDSTKYSVKGDHPSWNKVPSIRQVYNENPDAEWFWWLDMDAIIMNSEIDLAQHLLNDKVLEERIMWGRPVRDPDYMFTRYLLNKTDVSVNEIDILMAHDNMGWNAGSIFFRRSPFTTLMLDLWDDRVMRDKHNRQIDQTALSYLAFKHPEVFKHIGTVHQRMLNSYLDGAESGRYERGDLALHFPGNIKWRDDYNELWEEKFDSRIRPPFEFQYN